MITREFLEKHFKHHDKLRLFQGERPITITKEYHLSYNGGDRQFNTDCADLAELCNYRRLTLKPEQEDEE